MTFGHSPRQQASWDWRAAANFICGGMGSGLIVFAALSGVQGTVLTALLLAALALIGSGLTCVWFEIGRPRRALHVFLNPFTSWMTREAFCAALLFPGGVTLAVAGGHGSMWVMAALALAFVYCQGRMLQAAKGIPTWREPRLVPLIVATGLVEGGALFLATAGWHHAATQSLVAGFGLLVLLRVFAWLAYRRRINATPAIAAGARAALASAGHALEIGGTLGPLALAAIAMLAPVTGEAMWALLAAAAVLAATTGAWLKLVLVTRAGFTQGFALAHLPVRGTRSSRMISAREANEA